MILSPSSVDIIHTKMQQLVFNLLMRANQEEEERSMSRDTVLTLELSPHKLLINMVSTLMISSPLEPLTSQLETHLKTKKFSLSLLMNIMLIVIKS